MNGWAGTILDINLTSGKIKRETLSPIFARKYLGTNGFNDIRLFELVKPDVDALSPKNVLMFGVGPLGGTLVSGSGRLTITAKSPLTDALGRSSMGGFFGSELKYSGYDQIIFRGKAKKPVYLWINDDEVELRDASELWGKTTDDTSRIIREELGDPDIQVVSIGLAGENLVRFASVVYVRGAAGRYGMGAVMGSKNLKAVAVRGTKGVSVANPDEFYKASAELYSNSIIGLASSNKWMHEFGTPHLMELYFSNERLGFGAGVRNYQSTVFPGWEAVGGEAIKKNFAKTLKSCTNCPIACKVPYTIDEGEFAGTHCGGIEFAMTGGLAPRGEITNLAAILKVNELMNSYGMDVSDGTYAIVWAMDCYERGILTEEDLDGLSMGWGNYKSAVEMTHKIAKREGFGNILAEGPKRAPKLVGKGSEKFMYHVKGGQYMPEDPRIDKAFGLQHHTATRGADHLTGNIFRMIPIWCTTSIGKIISKGTDVLNPFSTTGKGKMVKWCEDITALVNASGMCTRPASAAPIQLLVKLLSSATGVDFTEEELLQLGERIYNVEKAFNSRQGLTRKDDEGSIPDKFTKEPIPDGKRKGDVLDLKTMLDEYYEARCWDKETGLQTRQKLVDLGLGSIADELEKMHAIR